MPAIIRNGHIYSASPKAPIDADNVNYDNSTSGLTATDAQEAIDELKDLVDQDQDTTYTIGTNGNSVTLTPSEGNAQSITVPYATNAGSASNASSVSGHTVATDVPADAVFTDTTYENATTAVAGLMSTADKSKLNGIASGAEVNQNAFSNIVANGTTVSADSKTDTLTIEAGSNVTITGDATNDKITISATDTTYSDATTATHGLMSTTDKSKLDGIAAGAEVNVQANWTETNSSADAYIKNKPTLGTAAAKDVPATGNASTSQVVMGNDTRLSDARNAADVYSWAKASTKPTYSYSEITDTPTIPTITDTYSGTSSDGMSGKAVKSAIDALDGTITGTAGAGKTLTALSQTNGKVSATFGNISITKSQVSDFPSLGNAAAKNYTTSVTNGSSDLVTSGAVWTAIDNLPEPMVFRGSLGTGGTITALPVDGSAAIGDTYKVITAGTYASKAAKVGDTFICLTKTSSANTWELIPSGDEPSGTVTSVGVSNGGGLSVSGSPVTTSGTITISHADTSSQASVNNSGRTYIQDITLDTYGHVTGIASATETVTNTDRYVNAASFAHDSTNDNVKMTLTRAGSDTATVTGNIPKVSSSSAGVAPKGAAVSSQTQTTKFLREDGTWAAPSYTTNTNTTYTFAAGTNSFKVTPSGGTAQTVNVTPSVSKSDVGLGSVANIDQSKAIKAITRSGKTFTATALDGTTSTFNQQDNNTTYSNATTAANGLMSKDDKSKLDGIASGATANSFATGTTNGTINVNTNGSTVDVAVKGLAALAYKSSLGKSDVGLGNVANLDQSKAIKSITRSGTTFTATAIDGTTSTFTQQDNNTTYSNATTAAAGLMSKDDKVKLNGVATGATANTGTVTGVTIKATSPIAIDSDAAITTSGTRTLSHANSGATAGSYGDSSNQTPVYGGTFKVPYITVNATGHVTGISTHTVKIPASDNTDTKVTAEANHYDPAASTASELKADASGATAAWSIDVVKGVQVQRDSKGHVTGLSVTSGKIPSNPNTDTKVRQSLSTANSNLPLLLSYAANTTTTANVDNVSYRSNSIYANPSTGNLQVTKLNGVDVGSSPKFTDNNTTYAAGTGVTISGSNNAINVTYGSAANTACQGNDSRLSNERQVVDNTLTNQDLNRVMTPGFYSAGGSNSVTNKPSGVDHFGLLVIHGASGSHYIQIIYAPNTAKSYRRFCTGGATSWSAWVEEKITDANTTYTFANGTNSFTVTPSGGTAQTVTVTPSVSKSDVGLGNVTNYNQAKAIKSITRSGTTFTMTALDGTTSTFNQQDNNTTYSTVSTTANGLAPKITNTANFLKGDGTWTMPTKANVGLGNVANYDQSKAIKSITRSGTTFTTTALDGTTSTFNQQDNNTWTALVGATSAANGSVGYINATPPKDGYNTKYFRADGTWAVPPNTKYTASTTSIGSASTGTAIAADDITAWSAGTAASASVANGVLTITNGTAPSLSYTARSIPNISVASKTVVTGITAS